MAKNQMQDKVANPSDSGSNRLFTLALIGVVVLGLAGVAAVASSRGSGESATIAEEQTGSIEVIGDTLPQHPQGVSIGTAGNDPAVGSIAPSIVGTGFDGEPVVIEADGQPKAVYFLAHWCPHCQAEVPLVQNLIANGSKPDNMAVYAVSTSVDAGRGNFPPEEWLQEEGLEAIIMRDDDTSSAMASLGGSSFPYTVYLDGDNRVIARSAGSLDSASITQLWAQTSAG